MSKNVADIWASLKASTAVKARPKQPNSDVGSAPACESSQNGSVVNASQVAIERAAQPPLPALLSAEGAFLASIQRDINCLKDADRTTRKQAISKLLAVLGRGTQLDPQALQDVLAGPLLQPLAHMLSDSFEQCRDVALQLIAATAPRMVDASALLPAVVPALCQRMGVGQPAAAELSEELRLSVMRLTSSLLIPCSARCGDKYAGDIAHLLSRGLQDAFHEIRRETCSGVVALASSASRDSLRDVSDELVDRLLPCLHHQHSRVRAAALRALDAAVRASPVAADALSTKLAPALKAVALDKVPALRSATFTALAGWLGRPDSGAPESSPPCPQLASYAPHVLPILILGITDDDPEVAAHALQLVDDVGAAYCRHLLDGARADGVADMEASVPRPAATASTPPGEPCAPAAMDVDLPAPPPGGSDARPGTPSQRPGAVADDATGPSPEAIAAAQLPAIFNGRASPHARRMVARELPAILPPVIREIREWTVALRATASRSLHALVALAEGHVVPHLPTLLPALAHAVGDEAADVALRIIGVAHAIGAFCEVRHWLPLMLETAAAGKRAPGQLASFLVILSALLHAAATAGRHVDGPLLARVAQWLASEDVRSVDHGAARRQLAMAVANLVDLAGPGVSAAGEPLLHVLLHLQGSHQDGYLDEQLSQTQHKLAEACNLESPAALAATHAAALLATLLQRCGDWTATHPDVPGFVALVRTCPGVTLAALGESLCAALGSVVVDHERDGNLRMTLLRLVDSVLENDAQAPLFCAHHAPALLCTVLLPPLVWRAGKAGAAVRYDALTALHTLLAKRRVTADVLAPLLVANGQLIPLIVQSMDEDWYKDTRLMGCHTMTQLLQVAGSALDDAARRSIYPELNKRMDDSSNDVRIATTAAIVAFAEHAMPADYCDTNSGYFVAALLIHLDDGNADVQAAVQAALFALAAKKGRVVRAEIGKVRDNFRSKFLLDQVLEACC